MNYDELDRKKVGLILACAIVAVIAIGAIWQLAFAGSGGSSETSGSGDTSESANSSSDGGSSGEDGGQSSPTATTTTGGATTIASGGVSAICNRLLLPGNTKLSTEEKDNLQAATEKFLLTAYENPGSDPERYEKKIDPLIAAGEGGEGCFWNSDVGGRAESMEELARAGDEAGGQGAPVFAQDLVSFELVNRGRVEEAGTSYTYSLVKAVWVSRNPETGEYVGWQSDLTLAKSNSGSGRWQVLGGDNMYSEEGNPNAFYDYRHQIEEKVEELKASG